MARRGAAESAAMSTQASRSSTTAVSMMSCVVAPKCSQAETSGLVRASCCKSCRIGYPAKRVPSRSCY